MLNFFYRKLLLAASLLCLMTALASNAEDARIVITEILADNEEGIRDEDGDRKDWIELFNAGTNRVELTGWSLTDKIADPDKWQFPSMIIDPGQYLLIWASGKDRRHPARPLHTDFSLSKGGEYVGLYRPDPADGTPVLVDEYAPSFPALPPDVSYGLSFAALETNLVRTGDFVRYNVLSSSQGDAFYFGNDYEAGHLGHGRPDGWNAASAFDDAVWISARTGIGYDLNGDYLIWLGDSPASNCQSALRGINTSLCLRRTFIIDNAADLQKLTLKMKYEDGFVAFVNGFEVARANCTAAMAYNTKADAARNEEFVSRWSEYNIPIELIDDGANLLAVQAMNSTISSSDFLIIPEIEVAVIQPPRYGYYSMPTPSEANGVPVTGALLFDAQPSNPDIPRPTGNIFSPLLAVSVKVRATAATLAAVRVFTRIMYDEENPPVLMHDDGIVPDSISGDGIYSAWINTGMAGSGEMLRWRFEAQAADGTVTRLPAYLDVENNSQYYGTVALDDSVATSQLNTLYWFVQNAPVTGPAWDDFRGSCYYKSNFYDNVGHTIHGQSTKNFPKKSYNFDFTDENRFLWQEGERRVKDINLLSNYADKTKTRNTIAHWAGEQMGTPAHFCYPVRVHLNTEFHGVMDLMEDSDDRMLERNGLDPEGALYKIYKVDLLTDVDKKTRKEEDNQDLIDLAAGLSITRPLSERTTYAYDNMDIAALVNYVAARQITADSDHGHKNFMMYRDTERTLEWQPIVWDVDLSFGHMFTAEEKYFDDTLYYQPPQISLTRGANSVVYKALYDNPEIRMMWARRMRTLMDRWMQPPGTLNGIFENKMLEIVDAIDPDPTHNSGWTDADLDTAKWGIVPLWDLSYDPRQELNRVVTEYYPNRRDYLFKTDDARPAIYGTVIPANSQVNYENMIVISTIENMPASQLLAEKFIILQNMSDVAVDLSGWTIEGALSHTLRPGTIIPSGSGLAQDNYVGLLHVVKDAAAFRLRETGPTGGERRFVQGNFEGSLPAAGGGLTLRDNVGTMIFTTNYTGQLSPSQQSLRVTEISYHPADPTPEELAVFSWLGDGDFEYLELKNNGALALNLMEAAFVQGIKYSFPDFCLYQNERILVVRNPVAFSLRYPDAAVPIFGPFEGALDNSTDHLVLIDAGGETVLDFEYSDVWYDLTDGSGRSLVLRDENLPAHLHGDPLQWNVSWNSLGSPGVGEEKTAQSYSGWLYTRFTATERADPRLSDPFANPDNDGRPNWVEYALGSDPKRGTSGTPLYFEWLVYGVNRYVGLSYMRAKNAVDLKFSLLFNDDLSSGEWLPAEVQLYYAASVSGERESLNYRDTSTASAPRRFYTLRLEYSGDE